MGQPDPGRRASGPFAIDNRTDRDEWGESFGDVGAKLGKIALDVSAERLKITRAVETT